MNVTKITNPSDDDDVLAGASDGAGTGVVGTSSGGTGVRGAGGSRGVYGYSANGRGVQGASDSGIGVLASSDTIAISANVGAPISRRAGHALVTESGRIRFDQISGVATIPSGVTSVTVDPNVVIEAGSFVLLTPRVNLYGRSLWYTPNTSANTFRIRMSSARPKPTRIAWLLVG